MKRAAALVAVALLLLPVTSAEACPSVAGIRLSDCDDDERKPRRSRQRRGSAQPAGAASAEAELLRELNAERARRGLRTLAGHSAAASIARDHARTMARYGSSFHNPSLNSSQTRARLGSPRYLAENVGHGPSAESIQLAYLNSSEHRHNMLNTVYDHVGVGVVKDGRYFYAVEVFLGGARSTGGWYGGTATWGARARRAERHGTRVVRATALLERMLPAIPPRIEPHVAALHGVAAGGPWSAIALGIAGLLAPWTVRGAGRLRRRA